MSVQSTEQHIGPLVTPEGTRFRVWAPAQRTLAAWRYQGSGPVVTRLGGRVAYRVDDVEAFEREQAGVGHVLFKVRRMHVRRRTGEHHTVHQTQQLADLVDTDQALIEHAD